jgi:hypothetical protein
MKSNLIKASIVTAITLCAAGVIATVIYQKSNTGDKSSKPASDLTIDVASKSSSTSDELSNSKPAASSSSGSETSSEDVAKVTGMGKGVLAATIGQIKSLGNVDYISTLSPLFKGTSSANGLQIQVALANGYAYQMDSVNWEKDSQQNTQRFVINFTKDASTLKVSGTYKLNDDHVTIDSVSGDTSNGAISTDKRQALEE